MLLAWVDFVLENEWFAKDGGGGGGGVDILWLGLGSYIDFGSFLLPIRLGFSWVI